jgi:hypothetical protein
MRTQQLSPLRLRDVPMTALHNRLSDSKQCCGHCTSGCHSARDLVADRPDWPLVRAFSRPSARTTAAVPPSPAGGIGHVSHGVRPVSHKPGKIFTTIQTFTTAQRFPRRREANVRHTHSTTQHGREPCSQQAPYLVRSSGPQCCSPLTSGATSNRGPPAQWSQRCTRKRPVLLKCGVVQGTRWAVE